MISGQLLETVNLQIETVQQFDLFIAIQNQPSNDLTLNYGNLF
jgi:hypothetical protein